MRAFRITGEGAQAALDWLHVHAELLGVVEEDAAVTVWIDGPLPAIEVASVSVAELPPEVANATATGLENDRAILVAEDLLVRPPWVLPDPSFRGVELVVPRGMAFGSGEHASTQAALLLLHEVWSPVASFCDVGTGSGILALYAAARGCPRIEACDIEEPAVLAARELLPRAEVVLGGPELLPFAADFVVANMTGTELGASLPAILAAWNRHGPLVLSGMRPHEVSGIESRLVGSVTHRRSVGDFRAFVLRAE
jgi:hypothetical protein